MKCPERWFFDKLLAVNTSPESIKCEIFFNLARCSKINQIQNIIQISMQLQHI
jgi:hypothetical protein